MFEQPLGDSEGYWRATVQVTKSWDMTDNNEVGGTFSCNKFTLSRMHRVKLVQKDNSRPR